MLFSANEARAKLEAKIWKLHLKPVQEGINDLINKTLREVENSITDNLSSGSCVFDPPLIRNMTGLILGYFSMYDISQQQIEQVRNIVTKSVADTIKQQGYRMKTTKEGVLRRLDEVVVTRIIWSTERARKQWDLVIAHLIVRKILRKYVRFLKEEWLSPPNGRLYLRAAKEFHSKAGGI